MPRSPAGQIRPTDQRKSHSLLWCSHKGGAGGEMNQISRAASWRTLTVVFICDWWSSPGLGRGKKGRLAEFASGDTRSMSGDKIQPSKLLYVQDTVDCSLYSYCARIMCSDKEGRVMAMMTSANGCPAYINLSEAFCRQRRQKIDLAWRID